MFVNQFLVFKKIYMKHNIKVVTSSFFKIEKVKFLPQGMGRGKLGRRN